MCLLLHNQVHGSLLLFSCLNILRAYCGLRPCKIAQRYGLILAWFLTQNSGIIKWGSIWIGLDACKLIFVMGVIFGLWLFRLFLLLSYYWFWLIGPDFVILGDEQGSRATLKSLYVVDGGFGLDLGSASLFLNLFEHCFSDFAEVLLWVIWIELRQFSDVEVFQAFSAAAEKSIAICFIQTRQIRKFGIVLCFDSIRKWKYLLIIVRNARTDIDDSLSSRQILDNVWLIKIRLLWIKLLRNTINHILRGQES